MFSFSECTEHHSGDLGHARFDPVPAAEPPFRAGADRRHPDLG